MNELFIALILIGLLLFVIAVGSVIGFLLGHINGRRAERKHGLSISVAVEEVVRRHVCKAADITRQLTGKPPPDDKSKH